MAEMPEVSVVVKPDRTAMMAMLFIFVVALVGGSAALIAFY